MYINTIFLLFLAFSLAFSLSLSISTPPSRTCLPVFMHAYLRTNIPCMKARMCSYTSTHEHTFNSIVLFSPAFSLLLSISISRSRTRPHVFMHAYTHTHATMSASRCNKSRVFMRTSIPPHIQPQIPFLSNVLSVAFYLHLSLLHVPSCLHARIRTHTICIKEHQVTCLHAHVHTHTHSTPSSRSLPRSLCCCLSPSLALSRAFVSSCTHSHSRTFGSMGCLRLVGSLKL